MTGKGYQRRKWKSPVSIRRLTSRLGELCGYRVRYVPVLSVDTLTSTCIYTCIKICTMDRDVWKLSNFWQLKRGCLEGLTWAGRPVSGIDLSRWLSLITRKSDFFFWIYFLTFLNILFFCFLCLYFLL